ncbi:hypothetical protein Cni_G27889 [Canna indica]|uniref:Uncharacterized protein n=1 Tax=Canna indica TaxID=4628 RepID=A0AAQ3L1K5_9LILI|nr:hypothetical protein Cni_G27889 [Canna indica]
MVIDVVEIEFNSLLIPSSTMNSSPTASASSLITGDRPLPCASAAPATAIGSREFFSVEFFLRPPRLQIPYPPPVTKPTSSASGITAHLTIQAARLRRGRQWRRNWFLYLHYVSAVKLTL